MDKNPIEQFIIEFASGELSRKRFDKLQRIYAKASQLSFFTNDQLLLAYQTLLIGQLVEKNIGLEKFLTLKSTRSNSGIVVVSVLTKPYDCPGRCLYCPTQAGAPKSYLAEEPAVMRAITCNYDPYLQVSSRLKALEAVGHLTDKVNIRIIGGTWSAYPTEYRTEFVRELFKAANGRIRESGVESLENLQKQNETTKHRIVEISIETRQDHIDMDEIKHLRELGVTKVELGVQSLDDEILKLNNRGNDTASTIRATKLLKNAGFKVSYQMMVNLYGADLKRDLEIFKELFENPDFKPDHLKIYPLALVKEAEIYKLFEQKRYKPYTESELTGLLVEIKKLVPPYCRIERVIRDIPTEYIVEGGAKISNLRQNVLLELDKQNAKCQCIRCREIKGDYNIDEDYKMFRLDYEASDGREIFLSIESKDRARLLALLRLRIPTNYSESLPVLKNSAIIREMHTYGPQVAIGQNNDLAAQHQGFGTKLLSEAETIAKKEFYLDKVSIIAGVGVRGFFEKFSYKLDRCYMTKTLTKD
ncbi:MAG: tRNA uridine(34) 5-carboxymethylaminomethyl modification radical SAM/GNAT enzyme Elp3 [Patescibacteria group bacterium]|jgi:elongator complex protein 3